jgi:mannan endo-1,4-beta-mannosidase
MTIFPWAANVPSRAGALMTPRMLIPLVLFLGALMSSLSTAAPAHAAFVTRSGTHLYLNGQPFVFSGLNDWNANSRPGNQACGYQPNVARDLADWGSGPQVMRAWFFQMFATRSTGARDWTAFDQTLAAARASGKKVIAVLADQWDSCESTFKDARWYRTGYTQTVLPKDRVTYYSWVQEVARRYAANDTILAWELVNEPEVDSRPGVCAPNAALLLHNFAGTVASTIRRRDPHHLIALGTMGGGQCGADDTEYAYVNAPAAITVCTYHDYGDPTVPLPGDQWNGLARRIGQCNALNKPLMIDESGILLRDSGGSTKTRGDYFAAKIDAAFARGVVGYLSWAWNDAAHGGSVDDYGVGPGDPTLRVLGSR